MYYAVFVSPIVKANCFPSKKEVLFIQKQSHKDKYGGRELTYDFFF